MHVEMDPLVRRFRELLSYLKENKLVKSYKHFGELVEENNQSIIDLRSGKKKLSIEHLTKIKEVFPFINPNWLAYGEGKMINPMNNHEDIKSLGLVSQMLSKSLKVNSQITEDIEKIKYTIDILQHIVDLSEKKERVL